MLIENAGTRIKDIGIEYLLQIDICIYWSSGLISREWWTQQFWMDVIVNIAVKT